MIHWQMELQMKAICEGHSTKQDVVNQSLEQYRAVYTRTRQQIGVLKAVRAAPLATYWASMSFGDDLTGVSTLGCSQIHPRATGCRMITDDQVISHESPRILNMHNPISKSLCGSGDRKTSRLAAGLVSTSNCLAQSSVSQGGHLIDPDSNSFVR
jgi:hypothetical protein